MFGLKDERNKEQGAQFDLEKDLKGSGKQKEIKEKIQGRMLKIKSLLREGLTQEDFNQFGVLLHGYAALLKVIARFAQQRK